jgi:UTP--glucose-1-phosphate uridylyltransferase
LKRRCASRGKTVELKSLEDMLPAAGATSFTRQQAPHGLGHAVWCARDIVGNEPFALLFPDMVMRAERRLHVRNGRSLRKVGGNIVAVGECDPALAHKYGIVGKGETLDGGFRITQMVEKPAKGTAPSNYYINGRYILQPEILVPSWRFRSAVQAMKSRSRMRC